MSDARCSPSATRKQSIYSFQGAAPEAFAESGLAFSERVRDARGQFRACAAQRCPSAPPTMCSAPSTASSPADQARRGLTFAGDPVEHAAIRAGAPGYVEVWPSHRRRYGRGAGRLDDSHRPRHRTRRAAGRDHRRKPIDQLAEIGRGDRGQRQAARPRRRAGAGAQARQFCQRAGQEPEGAAAHPGRRRRPLQPSRSHRRQGHDRARPLRAPAGGRSVAGRPSEEPDLRPLRGRAFSLAAGRPDGTSLDRSPEESFHIRINPFWHCESP